MTWLLFPFAIRYHALHHLCPTLPYHNLKAAHAHLRMSLPAESPYHTLDQPSWWHVAKRTLFPTMTVRTPVACNRQRIAILGASAKLTPVHPPASTAEAIEVA